MPSLATRHVRPLFVFLTVAFAAPELHAQAPVIPSLPGAQAGAMLHLMPVPASIRVDSGRLPITRSFTAVITTFRNERLNRGVERALTRLALHTGLEIAREPQRPSAGPATLIIHVRSAGQAVQTMTEDESYTLDVTPEQCTLEAATVVGALRGLETFLQLVESDRDSFYLPLAHIQDRPRFPWRGLLIDVSRHWEPVEVIERNLDAMAMVKMNVLHWHLSDDQGFRVESRRYPKLQEKGSDGQYYTQEQIRHIVAYARDRGIRVVPEFDMPGHATSWFVGYPQFASGPGPYEITRNFGAGTGEFDPTRESVYRFLSGFVGEMAKLFPDPYWHIGGDEVIGKQWEANRSIRLFMRRHHLKNNDALQAYFNRRLARILQVHHKRVIGWDEILRPDLPKSVIVQSWRGQESLGEGAKEGFKGILSAGYYLDAMQPAATHYMVDPVPAGSDLDSTQAARILGGEACMWGELITPENIDSRIWPRTAAIAERLWSLAGVTDVRDMYRRLAFVSVELEDAGIRHLSGPGVMLRRIAGTDGIESLRALMQLVEPLSLHQRMRSRRPTQLTPLVFPGDIARPDPVRVRRLAAMADTLVRDTPRYALYRDSLAHEFRSWRDLGGAVAALTARDPLGRDIDSVATNLTALGAAGEEALSYLSQGATPPPEWTTTTLSLLDRIAAPAGLLRLSAVAAVRPLVLAASKVSSASSMSSASR
jgi:hexosaminidase